MADATFGKTPEGRIIEQAAKADGRSIRKLAANAGISDARWRQIVKGWQSGPGGQHVPVHAPTMTLVQIALVLGLTESDLREAGRDDAAALVTDFKLIAPGTFLRVTDGTGSAMPSAADVRATAYNARVITEPGGEPDEIDLIYASNTMTPREKLLRIRQVLELRAEAEVEEAGQQKAAPAKDAEAAENELPENQPS